MLTRFSITRKRLHTITAGAGLSSIVLLCALAFLTFKATQVGQYEYAVFQYPFQRDDAEGVILGEASLILQGKNPYSYQPSPSHYFFAGPYTPLYTLVNSLGLFLFNVTFKVGRIVQFVATIMVSIWIAHAITWATPTLTRRLVGIWAGFLFFTMHLVVVWSVLIRPDMSALAWNLLGVTVLRPLWMDPERYNQEQGDVLNKETVFRLFVGATCFAFGWWTKQTSIAAPLACMLCMSFKYRKVAALCVSFYATMILIPTGVLSLFTSGGFVQKVIVYQGSWDWHAYLHIAQPFIDRYGFLLIITLFLFAYNFIKNGVSFSLLWFFLSAGATLGAGTSGGNHNHFVEVLAAASYLVGDGLATGVTRSNKAATNVSNNVFRSLSLALIAVITIFFSCEHEGKQGWLARMYRYPTQDEILGYRQVTSYITNANGLIYSDNVGAVVVAHQLVQVSDPFTMATAVRLGRWDEALLIEDIKMKKYRLIVLRVNLDKVDIANPPTDSTPALIEAIRANYRLTQNNVLKIYEPFPFI